MTEGKKKRILVTVAIILAVMALLIWMILDSTVLELNTYTIADPELPEGFDGYRIAHISDLHNAQMGKGNEKLLALLREAKPDIIAFTGDMIDSRNTKTEIALQFVAEAVKIAPCYYVTGNHEARVSAYEVLKTGLEELGVILLEDASAALERSGDKLFLLGVNDPSFQTDYLLGDSATLMQNKLELLPGEEADYRILLSHRPELFDVYADAGLNLVLSGHAHGGQFRLPFLGGLVAPNQGLFPQYDSGLYTENGTHMLVSRGIGNSIIPFRLNNRPEVILIELQCENE
ncbi:MAG: metallophosphoesterase [Oscillospiraceae bacterium]|nr:metallophosphoesterase [Oscillospiraceae bacterium]